MNPATLSAHPVRTDGVSVYANQVVFTHQGGVTVGNRWQLRFNRKLSRELSKGRSSEEVEEAEEEEEWEEKAQGSQESSSVCRIDAGQGGGATAELLNCRRPHAPLHLDGICFFFICSSDGYVLFFFSFISFLFNNF